MHIHHHYHHIEARCEVMRRLDALDQKIDLVLKKQETTMATQADIAAALAKVQADVAAETTLDASILTFIQGLQAQIAALAAQTTDTTTAAALTALSTQMETNATPLAAAITANTPAA